MTAKVDHVSCVEVVRLAYMFRRTVAEEVAFELAEYRRQQRAIRHWLNVPGNCDAQPRMAGMKADNYLRIGKQVRRLNALRRHLASVRGEHPSARLPTFKSDVKPPCEPQIAAMAERLQETVERAVWDFLYAQKS